MEVDHTENRMPCITDSDEVRTPEEYERRLRSLLDQGKAIMGAIHRLVAREYSLYCQHTKPNRKLSSMSDHYLLCR